MPSSRGTLAAWSIGENDESRLVVVSFPRGCQVAPAGVFHEAAPRVS